MFGGVKTTKNVDVDKYKYSGYCIGFDGRGVFTHPDGSFGNNAIIFGVDMSSSVRIDNKGKDILILGNGPTQGLGGHSLTAENETRKKFCLTLILFTSTILCLGNVSYDFSVTNMKKTGLYGNVYEFSADYGTISVDNILNIQKYLMKKHNIT